MKQPSPMLQHLLLDLIGEKPAVDADRIGHLGRGDWEQLLDMARQHRLSALLYWQLTHARAGLPVPADVLAKLQERHRQATLRALKLKAELLRAHQILSQAGIRHAALKGAYLAFHAYPNPALRSMRDLDILVDADAAPAAYRLLQERGYQRLNAYDGAPDFFLPNGKHLPGLLSPDRKVQIELHTRIHRPEYAGRPVDADPGLWDRLIHASQGSANLPFLSPTDTLLHLIVHGAYDHHFDNGPLILSDLAWMVRQHPMDWPGFWERAERGGWSRGCYLLLKMTEHYFDGFAFAPPAQAGSWQQDLPALLETATLLTLRDFDGRHGVHLQTIVADKGGLPQKLRRLVKASFPSRAVISNIYKVPEHSPRIHYLYIWRMAQRLGQYIGSHGNRRAAREARQVRQLVRWLGESDAP